jgi:hypothetical protein
MLPAVPDIYSILLPISQRFVPEVEHSPESDASAYGKKMNTHALAARGERPD